MPQVVWNKRVILEAEGPEFGCWLTPVFPGGSDGKASAYNAGDLGLIVGQEHPLEKEMVKLSYT